ncbi:MAG: AgmX/PglI C-terminal domain-containing protein [Gammaproteobacteria bacterium]
MNSQVFEEQEQISLQIEAAQQKIVELEDELRKTDIALDGLHTQSEKYRLLDEISDRLSMLNKLDGAGLVWGDEVSSDQAEQKIQQLKNQAIIFDDEVLLKQQARERIKDGIQSVIAKISLLNDEILVIQERAEERENEFVIEREMVAPPYQDMVMPWTIQGEDEKRFRKILLITVLVSVLLGYLIPLWNIPLPDRFEPVEIPERLAKLIVKKEPPKPPPEVKELPQDESKEKKPRKDKPKPKKEETQIARAKAESSGLMAFKDNFADLMDDAAEDKLGAQARISNRGQKARSTARSLVTATATGGSGGIKTAGLSRNVGGAGEGLEGVSFSRVESAIGGDFFGDERPLSDGPGPSRTDEEIQIVFDRYKAALYRIYNRELRKNPTLQGKVVLRMTIEPNGKVSHCKIESSDLKSPNLEKNIVARVLKFNFGPKEDVPALSILYPIDFLPAS